MSRFRSIILEGVDRIGKSTLIEGLNHRLGFFQELHYQKPRLLNCYLDDAVFELTDRHTDEITGEIVYSANTQIPALKAYQVASFTQMFRALESKGRFLLNRSHIGEAVYAQRYRGYSGDYVFDLERQFNLQPGSTFVDTTLLVLVYTSDLSFITEDGQSLGGLDKREGEQADFKVAFDRSIIRHKIAVDVCDGQGKFRSKLEVLEEVLEAWNQ